MLCAGHQETAFIEEGYNKWNVAVSAGKGFVRHMLSDTHVHAMKRWREFKSNPVSILTRMDPNRKGIEIQVTFH